MTLTSRMLGLWMLLLLFVENTLSRPSSQKSEKLKITNTNPNLDFDVINDNLRVEGMPLFQGDMVMDGNMVAAILEDEWVPKREKRMIRRLWRAKERRAGRQKRAAVKNENRIWGDGTLKKFVDEGLSGTSYAVIPFVYDPNLPDWTLDLVLKAIKHWEVKTKDPTSESYCLKFVPWSGEENYLSFAGKNGCWSTVGKSETAGPQTVSVGPPCASLGLMAHEVGHALGFFHEQSRPDRDDWIRIIEENVKQGREHNFVKYSEFLVNSLDVGYDYSSIMHYKTDAFSKNGKDTMEPVKELQEGEEIGQRVGASEKDVEQIRRMYKCPGATIPTTIPPTTRPKEEDEGEWIWDWKNGKWVFETKPTETEQAKAGEWIWDWRNGKWIFKTDTEE